MSATGDEENFTCPSCSRPVSGTVPSCPNCGTSLPPRVDTAVLDEGMAATFDRDMDTSPRWAVALTGLALGIAIAPLVAYSAVILLGDPPAWIVGVLMLAGWLLPGSYLARFPNPSAALARGLYLIAAGVVAVGIAVFVDLNSGGESALSSQAGLLVIALILPAVLAVLLARRVAVRADRQLRGELGPLHERAGVSAEDDDPATDDP